jgi:hypothetical protein
MNSRIYPKEVLDDAVEKYRLVMLNEVRKLKLQTLEEQYAKDEKNKNSCCSDNRANKKNQS